jgi:hypothetical protein
VQVSRIAEEVLGCGPEDGATHTFYCQSGVRTTQLIFGERASLSGVRSAWTVGDVTDATPVTGTVLSMGTRGHRRARALGLATSVSAQLRRQLGGVVARGRSGRSACY